MSHSRRDQPSSKMTLLYPKIVGCGRCKIDQEEEMSD